MMLRTKLWAHYDCLWLRRNEDSLWASWTRKNSTEQAGYDLGLQGHMGLGVGGQHTGGKRLSKFSEEGMCCLFGGQ